MNNKKFLGNKYVTVVRYFDYKGTLKAAVKDHTGKVFAVNASELTHVRNTGDEEVAESVSEPVSKVEDDEVVVESPESPSEDTQEPEPEPEVEVPEQPEVPEVEEPETPETPVEQPEVEPEVQEETVTEPVESDEFKTITAINTKTSEETELTTEDELVDFATEHELDLGAIDRVLAGEQNTHKGFEFK